MKTAEEIKQMFTALTTNQHLLERAKLDFKAMEQDIAKMEAAQKKLTSELASDLVKFDVRLAYNCNDHVLILSAHGSPPILKSETVPYAEKKND